jgi:hypothetical protein
MTSARTALTTTAAALMLALAPAAWALNAQQAVEAMQGQGYVAPHDLEKQYGYWTAKATSPDGQRAYVLVADADGGFTAIRKADLGTTLPGAAQVADKLRSLGYSVIRDLEFDDGFWEAEAVNPAGQRVDLYINATTGAVEREKLDD